MGNAAIAYFSNYIASALHMYSMGMIPQKFGKELFDAWEEIIVNEKHANYSLSWELQEEIGRLIGEIGFYAGYDVLLQCNKEETAWHISKPVPAVECNPFGAIQEYMNRADINLNVRSREQPVVEWNGISMDVLAHYKTDNDAVAIYKDVIALVQNNLRVLYFTGDMDLVCPPLQVAFGTGRIARDNEMTEIKVANSTWRYMNDLAGSRTSYASKDGGISLDVLTVRGAGHMVPINQPDRAFQLINNFISAPAGTEVDYSKMIPRK